jgi:hypothetical protein
MTMDRMQARLLAEAYRNDGWVPVSDVREGEKLQALVGLLDRRPPLLKLYRESGDLPARFALTTEGAANAREVLRVLAAATRT